MSSLPIERITSTMPDRIPADWPPVRTIKTPSELAVALQEWNNAGIIGVDTESNSFYAYTDKLCLVQVTAGEIDYIVDPIALGEDLKAFNDILADPAFIKIFHAAEFDLMLLKKDLGVEMKGLFDTQVAMTLLQHEKTGLAALIDAYYGIKLSKKEQRSNWGKRPLSEAQLAYARIDTHFLPDLHNRLTTELEEKGMTAAAEGEFRRLEREILPPREPNFEGWRKLKGAKALSPSASARLKATFRWREELAIKLDRPVFRVMANEVLISIANRPPRNTKELASLKGVGWNMARRNGEDILSALQSAEGERIEAPTAPKRTPEERRKHRILRDNKEALRQWRKKMAEELGLPSERLMHRRHLEELGKRLPQTRQELLDTIELNDWQRENLEASLLLMLESLPDPNLNLEK